MIRRRPNRGAALMEVVIALAIFVAAASFTLRATSDVLVGLDRAAREQRAVDLARSKLAELELGLISLEDLRDAEITSVGSLEAFDGDTPDLDGAVWICDVQTSLGPVLGTSVVELTVIEQRPGRSDVPGLEDDRWAARFTLRQVMQLREDEAESYREDDLLQGLPGVEP